MIETEALTFGGWGHFFLIIKAIPQCLRIRIMLKKCWHRLTLEIRARHFFSILTLFFFFPSSYLRDSWNGPVHGKRSQIPAADFSGRRHLLLCQRMRPCDIVSRWPHGSVSRRRNRTGPSERTVFMVDGTRATQRLLLRTSISSLKAMGTESNFKFYKTKRIQQILYFFFFYISMNTIYPIPKACFSIFVNAHTSAQTLHP